MEAYATPSLSLLTHWGRDKMTIVIQTTFWMFLNENVWISSKISLKFIPKGPINNILALVQIMDWCRSGDKPLSEPTMVCLSAHLCITWPQWVPDWKLLEPLLITETNSTSHYGDVIMGAIASQVTSLTIVYSTVCSDADQRKHQSSASLVFVRGIHRGPVNSPHKWPVTRKMFPSDDVIMIIRIRVSISNCIMMTSSNGDILRVTGHLCGEFTGQLWIPRTKASDAELLCFLWAAPE